MISGDKHTPDLWFWQAPSKGKPLGLRMLGTPQMEQVRQAPWVRERFRRNITHDNVAGFHGIQLSAKAAAA
jgi:hypothetical protein